jgi:Zn-dependent protease with chaperone function
MITALALGLYALAAATAGAAWLNATTWSLRAPRLGILAWQVLCLNVVVGALLAGLALAVRLPHLSTDLASFIDACAATLKHAYDTPGGDVATASGSALLVGLAARLAWSTARSSLAERGVRRKAVATADLTGRRDVVEGATVLEHDTAYAFCVPGRHARIVLTSAAIAVLDDTQLRAVLAHERAHLRGRHHLALGVSRSLVAAFPWVPAFRLAQAQTAILVELLADDCARRQVSAHALGGALGSLSRTGAPETVLAASAVDVHRRLRRLSAPLRPLQGLGRLVALIAIAAGLALPFAVVATPAVAAATEGLCLIG